MSLNTFSQFFYGHAVTGLNYSLDFSEGGPVIEPSIPIGDYSLTTLLAQVQTQLNAAGGNGYTVTVSRETRIVTISAPGNFELLVFSGIALESLFSLHWGLPELIAQALIHTQAIFPQVVDVPQFILQDHVSTNSYKSFIDPAVNVSSSGEVQVVRFGVQQFMECNIKYATNEPHPKVGPITNNPTGYDDLVSFMDYIINKNKIEYMEDLNDANQFEIMLLESTPSESNGTGYKLKEQYGEGLPFHFETGVLRFRKVQ